MVGAGNTCAFFHSVANLCKNSRYQAERCTHIFSELQKRFSSRQEIADHLLERCNFLGKMNKVNVNVNQGIVGA